MLPMSVYPNRARTSEQHSLTLCGNCDTFITKYRGLFMATIKEIAALAGVSRGTVDRVLNDRGAVNPETAEKIRKIAKEYDVQLADMTDGEYEKYYFEDESQLALKGLVTFNEKIYDFYKQPSK